MKTITLEVNNELADKFNKMNKSKREALLKILIDSITASTSLSDLLEFCRDPKDNKYLELALSGQADCIITSDRDLLSLNPFKNISIISPSEFLDQSYTAYTLKL